MIWKEIITWVLGNICGEARGGWNWLRIVSNDGLYISCDEPSDCTDYYQSARNFSEKKI
jgi:hypothetical protein